METKVDNFDDGDVGSRIAVVEVVVAGAPSCSTRVQRDRELAEMADTVEMALDLGEIVFDVENISCHTHMNADIQLG